MCAPPARVKQKIRRVLANDEADPLLLLVRLFELLLPPFRLEKADVVVVVVVMVDAKAISASERRQERQEELEYRGFAIIVALVQLC